MHLWLGHEEGCRSDPNGLDGLGLTACRSECCRFVAFGLVVWLGIAFRRLGREWRDGLFAAILAGKD